MKTQNVSPKEYQFSNSKLEAKAEHVLNTTESHDLSVKGMPFHQLLETIEVDSRDIELCKDDYREFVDYWLEPPTANLHLAQAIVTWGVESVIDYIISERTIL